MALEATSLYQQDLFWHNIININTINNNNDDLYSLSPETCFSTTNIDTYSINNSNIILSSPFLKGETIPQNQEHYNYINGLYSNNDFNFLEGETLLQQFDNGDYCSDNYNYNINDGIIPTNYDIIPKGGFYTLNNNNNNNMNIKNKNDDHYDHEGGLNSSPETGKSDGGHTTVEEVVTRPRRRRAKVEKKREDIENQRMTHIVVERNRRKQMNEYLNVLRSLMPESYVQRGDQASIVGGAINFVKELEQNLQCLSAKKDIITHNQSNNNNNTNNNTNTSSTTSHYLPFQEFFTFPQYSTNGHGCSIDNDQANVGGGPSESPLGGGGGGGVAADVEVTMVESHANLRVRLKCSPNNKMLSKLVSGLMCLRLAVLHLNVNTAAGFVFYSFNLKVEDDSKLNTVDEIAKAVYNLLGRILEDQATFVC